jgi:uncharacterized Fe-S cluster protein YjdI/CDGSH-type Zn-finger protein
MTGDAMASDPSEAGAPRTRDAIRVYENERIRVLWDATLCIHTAICLKRLPSVFDVDARPWIDASGADAEDIASTIRACPTGALRYDGDGVAGEVPDEPTTVEVRPNGPLYLRGRLRVQGPGGRDGRDEYRVALCRCGESENKPFCDNSHRLVGFRDGAPR